MHGGLAVDGVCSTPPYESGTTVHTTGNEHARAHEAAEGGLLVKFFFFFMLVWISIN